MSTQKALCFLASVSVLSLVGVFSTKPTQAQLSNCPLGGDPTGPPNPQQLPFQLDGGIFIFNFPHLVSLPNSLAFALSQPESIIDTGNLAIGQGQMLSLIGGTTINTGTVWTPGGNITIAAVPGTGQVQLSQEGMVLSLKLNAANLSNNGLSPESLPGLITGGNLVSATEVSVDANGQVWLTGSNTQIPTETETVIVSGTIDASHRNSGQTGRTIKLLGEKVDPISANINTSGSNGGGTVLVGSDRQGEGTIPKAQRTFVSSDSVFGAGESSVPLTPTKGSITARNRYSDKGTVTLNATKGNIAIADSVSSATFSNSTGDAITINATNGNFSSTTILSKSVGNAGSRGNVTVNATIPIPSLNAELGAIALSSVESKTGEAQQENHGEIESRKIEQQQGQGEFSFTSPASSADVPKNLLDESTLPLAQQPNSNEDPLLQPSPEPQSSQFRAANPVLPTPTPETPTPPPKAEQPRETVSVRQSEVVGSTVFGSKEFSPITQSLQGRSVTLEELQGAAKAITRLYQEKGYLTSQAVVPKQRVTKGIVRIQVIEGSLAEIRIEGNRRVNSHYIRRRIQLGAKTPVRIDQLEDQLQLLRADPLFENLNAILESGSEPGQSVLVVQVKEAKAFYGNVSADNYSPPNVGSERFGVELGYRSLTGNGDNLSAAYYRSTTGGSNRLDLNYGIPLNAKNGTLQLRAVINRNKITKPFDFEGNAEGYEISFRQPLIRSPREEFALSVGLSFRDNQTFVNGTACRLRSGPEDNGVSRTRVFWLGQDYIKRDSQGIWRLASRFNLGTGLLDANTNESPIPDGRFFTWLGQVQRAQRLGKNSLLIAQAEVQLTPDSLLESEVFGFGGEQPLRGYRQNIRAGDNGFRFLLENRFTLQRNQAGESVFDLVPFFDMGAVWNHPDNPNKQPNNQNFLASLGLGLVWEAVPRLKIRLDYAVPFIDLKDRGENAQDEGFYFSVRYGF